MDYLGTGYRAMDYRVDITARAERDLESLYREVDAPRSEAARKWYGGLKRQILSLERLPSRCAVTPENKRLRHLLYGRKPHVYRVIYRIVEREKVVEVLHVRHGARKAFGGSEMD
jgi:mRNA-degrading endonuclease RelE of RelBE toxin-antitoxin system